MFCSAATESTLCILSSIYVLLHYQRGARRIAECDLRCKTYRESRHGTASRGEGVTSRCQTVPRLRDVPKGAHNWFANQSIDRCYWLVLSDDFNSLNLPYECPTFACQIFLYSLTLPGAILAPFQPKINHCQGISPYLCASTMIYPILCILQCFSWIRIN